MIRAAAFALALLLSLPALARPPFMARGGVVTPPITSAIPQTAFGMSFNVSTNWPSAPTIIGAMGKSGGTTWPWIESARGVYDWSNLDFALSVAQAHSVTALYGSDCTSNSAPAGCSGGAQPGGLGIPSWTTCVNLAADYGAFFTAFMARYGTQIPIIELWNEPGSVGCTAAQLAAATNAAQAAIRLAQPSVKILSPSFVGSHSYIASQIAAYYGAGGTQAVDGWTMHVYTEQDTPATPESFVADLAAEIAAMATNAPAVLGKPLWNTEGAAYDTVTGLPSEATMAAYVARYHLLTLAAGVVADYWYQWDAYAPIMGYAQAVSAYDQVEGWTVGRAPSGACLQSGTVWTCELSGAGTVGGAACATSTATLAVWDTSGNSSFTPPSPGTYSKYCDITGASTSYPGSGAITIGVAPVLFAN